MPYLDLGNLSAEFRGMEKEGSEMGRFDSVLAEHLPDQELAVAEDGEILDAEAMSEAERRNEACILGYVVGGLSKKTAEDLGRRPGLQVHTEARVTGIAAGRAIDPGAAALF
jgi:hypothetical protein